MGSESKIRQKKNRPEFSFFVPSFQKCTLNSCKNKKNCNYSLKLVYDQINSTFKEKCRFSNHVIFSEILTLSFYTR